MLLSPSTYERTRDLVEVGPPIPVEVKGLREPLLLYELHAIGGRWGRRLPETAIDGRPDVPVALPVACWVIEGKTIARDPVRGEVQRLGPRSLEARLAVAPPPLTNVRLRLRYPALGQESADLYGKVRPSEASGDPGVVRIDLTSVDAADREILESLLKAGRSGG